MQAIGIVHAILLCQGYLKLIVCQVGKLQSRIDIHIRDTFTMVSLRVDVAALVLYAGTPSSGLHLSRLASSEHGN